MNKKVVVGMSGGVDSSVAAHLLKEQGYDVIGVTMQIWQDGCESNDDDGCCGLSAADDARRVCDKIGIAHYVMNFKDSFRKNVIDYFAREYLRGRTPNPCIACNRYVKWEALLERALSVGADYIATGHYAGVERDGKSGRYLLKKSPAPGKDQSYALYGLAQAQLARTLMPLHSLSKDEVRKIASEIGLSVASKPDSQEICFIPDDDHGKFIEEYAGIKPERGNFIDISGNILGEHKGIFYYTIGQRKGLGLAFGKRVFVKKISAETNDITLADDEDLFESVVYASEPNFISRASLSPSSGLYAKIRYGHRGAVCSAEMEGGLVKCVFDEPQRAPTPGQALVLYDGDYVLGGGTIVGDAALGVP